MVQEQRAFMRTVASESNHSDPAREVEALEALRASAFLTQLWSSVMGLYDYTLLLEYCPYGLLEGLLRVNRSGAVAIGNVSLHVMLYAICKYSTSYRPRKLKSRATRERQGCDGDVLGDLFDDDENAETNAG
ncbi:hypothetical protein VOLCADRAFT_100920 [Volvox carteri f. nagariensis]|uniref:Protein kinase domain-containing protein n=1 Tax=Volvox carteri f. nagariensis TaxID=3068 RepID=D8ULC2_VOLCA|nr:uncharacterized protein VOLCADRAFT_100920 [Volvox carteri f. nagariensis]EFJ39477.1 hypothetical protein VOLCADRAFT_100920 [Volvox carteri f. nagariensis]|eukprot:XP_002959459.1 hypothetical protein VOLCADRAFT_100920 [Volvox carteri f. nagariensis]